MDDFPSDLERLSLTLFDDIPSQTGFDDRQALLTVQRAVARRAPTYSYLEIGSHLGGSLQPYVVDPRCTKIYSIDARPAQQPDDRAPGFVATYEDNSSARMLQLLRARNKGNPDKIVCFDRDASQVDVNQIVPAPQIVFIDGEHTNAAVRSDFAFCARVMSETAVVLFHDFSIVYVAILAIVAELRHARRPHVAMKLDGDVFGIFFDPSLVHEDERLRAHKKREIRALARFFAKRLVKRSLPSPLLTRAKSVRARLRGAS